MRRKRRLLSLILAVGLTFNSVGMYAEDMTENSTDVNLLLEESNDGLEQEIVLENESEGSNEAVISLGELSGEVDDFLVKVSTLDGSYFSDVSSLDLVGLKDLVKNDKSYDNVDSYKEYFKNFIVSELLKEDGEELSRSYENYSKRVIDVHPLLLCVNEEVQREKYKVNLGFTNGEFVKSLKDKEIRVYDFEEKDEKLVSNLLKSKLVENNLEFDLENPFIVVVELDKNWVKETVEEPIEEPVEESEVVVEGNEEGNKQVVDVINTIEEDGVFIEETQSNDEEKTAEVEFGTEKEESVFDEISETVLETESEVETETEEATEALVNDSTEVETEEIAETETDLESVSETEELVETESLTEVETAVETESETGEETESEIGEETESETETLSEVETETEELSETESETKKSTEAESENKDEEYLQVPEIYVYEDDEVLVKAYLKSTKFIGDDVALSVEKIEKGSDLYNFYYDSISDGEELEILPYDIHMERDGVEFEPECEVAVSLYLKNGIKAKESDELTVYHIKDNGYVEKVVDTEVIEKDKEVKSFDFDVNSFSGIVVANALGSGISLKSINTVINGEDVIISKTSNVKVDGTATTYYGNNENKSDKVDLSGAISATVVIKYRTESTSCDWLYIKDRAGNILKKDSNNTQIGDSSGKIGGGGSNKLTPSNTVTYYFENPDMLDFVWRTDSSVASYGYYAVITPEYPTEPVPDFHFEELEDGTYALVFDKGGNIEYFTKNRDIKEEIAPYLNKISEIRLNKNTTGVGTRAFDGLTSLKTVTMPRNGLLETIGDNAFRGCTNLESFNVPATVESISGTAFSGCTGLEEVTFDSNNQMTALEEGTFEGLTSLKEITLPDTLVNIPDDCFSGCTSLETINCAPLESIGENSFKGTKIYEVPELNGVTEIPSGAFQNCKNIKELPLEGVTSIGANAFNGCSGVEELSLPDTLETIGSNAFSNMTGITEVYIPESVTSIGSGAFSGCSNITDFVFDEGNEMTSIPSSLFSGQAKLERVVLPKNITEIPSNCFYNCSSLKSVDIPDGVTKIGDYAFYGCTRLQDFDIPESITTIGNYVFQNCTSLRSMEIPNTVSSIGTGLFYGCSGLITLNFEEGSQIVSLPSSMFYGCSKLENVKLPDGVTTIPSQYFRDCSSLKNVELPENLTTIGEYAFSGCYNLTDLELPNTLKTINSYAFYNCDSFVNVVIPNSVTTFGSYVFDGCENIETVIFEEGSRLTSMGGYAFRNNTKLRELQLPDSLTSVPTYLCYECKNLENVVLPNKATSIGSYAFYNCDKLTQVDIPSRVATIGTYAFYDCDGIRVVNLPETSLTKIESYAFYSCSNLEEIELPDTITSLGNYCFTYDKKLKSLHIPENSSLTAIPEYFADNCGIESLDIPDNIQYINKYAFRNTNIEHLVIPNSIKTIDNYAFHYNSSLKDVVFEEGGSSTCSIYSYAFSRNYALESIDLGGRVSTINTYAISNCPTLEELVIPESVTSIKGASAIGYNTGLKRLVFEEGVTRLNVGASGTNVIRDLPAVEEIVIDRDIYTSRNVLVFSNINPNAEYVIGEHVDALDNLFISQWTKNNSIIFEGENDFSVTETYKANYTTDPKWSMLKGDFYVDPNGVVYKLNKENMTASLFHIPDGLTEYTVPATITSVAGDVYNVTEIGSYVCREANDLERLTVENPEDISIMQYAFSGATSLTTINEKTEIYPDEWTWVSSMCDFPIHTDEPPEQVLTLLDTMQIGDGTGRFSFGVSISNQESMADDGLTYVYPTGRSARMDVVVSNESNMDMSDRVLRIYFAFDGENYTMGSYPPDRDYTLVNTQTGRRYPFKVRSTDASGVYYYDITGFKPGDTLAFNNNFQYSNIISEGGKMTVWIESLSSEEAQILDGKVSNPKKYIEAEWYSNPTPYKVTKSNLTDGTLKFVANQSDLEDENIYVQGLAFRMVVSSMGDSGTTNGKDYTKYITLEDDLVFPEGLMWNPKVIEAVRANNWKITTNVVSCKIDGEWVEIFQLTGLDSDYLRGVSLNVVKDNNNRDAIQIVEDYRNSYWDGSSTSYPTSDFPYKTFDLYFRNKAIMIAENSELWNMVREGEEKTPEESKALRTITNNVDKTNHYCFGEDQLYSSRSPERIIEASAGFRMEKNQTSDSYNFFGMKNAFNISLINEGLTNNRDIHVVSDSLPDWWYIKADDIESMFRDPKWGDYFELEIASATLCEQPNKSDKIDVNGNLVPGEYYPKDYGADDIPYNGRASTDDSEITISARLFIHWNDDKSAIVLDVANDEGVVSESYVIGQDYSTLQEALDEIGYIVVSSTNYRVKWVLPEDYVLKSGRTDVFNIPSTLKDTTKRLGSDQRYYYNYSNSSYNVSNTAYCYNRENTQLGSANYRGTVSRELTIYKYGTNGLTSLSNGSTVYDGSIVDYRLSFTNYGGEYEVLPLSDRMRGSQVLLVPVRGNGSAEFYPEGSSESILLSEADMPIVDEGGVSYYALNKAGLYKGCLIDGRITDTISVSRSRGYADTLMIWYWQDVTGRVSNSLTSVNRTINYKAIFDTTLVDALYEDEDGSSIVSYSLANETWLGGHQKHRLYDTLGLYGSVVDFSKWIVEDNDRVHENLIRKSLVQNGDVVTYKIILRNHSERNFKLSGKSIYDRLPTTKGTFAWSKNNVLDIEYDTTRGASVSSDSPNCWYINAKRSPNASDETSDGQYYIHWNDDFYIDFDPDGVIWIYVTVKFPSADDVDELGNVGQEWDNYITKVNGAEIYNYWYVGSKYSQVAHELNDVVEGYLQKGVLDTGLSSNSGKFKSEDTRYFYQNGSSAANGTSQEVVYYTVLYNSGNVRLYLDKLQDTLPKGFHFRGLVAKVPSDASTSSTYSTNSGKAGYYSSQPSVSRVESYYNGIPVATVNDPNRTVTYKNVDVSSAVTSPGEDGREHVSFTITGYTTNSSYLNYDTELGKYYLRPGEAIRFGYNCSVDGYKKTENIALNEITMPIYDKYGLGIKKAEDITVTPATYRDIQNNDGECDESLTEIEVDGCGHEQPTWGTKNTVWFSSNVSLQRLSPVPGVKKMVGGESVIPVNTQITSTSILGSRYDSGNKFGSTYTGTVSRNSIVNWKISVYNEGGTGTNSLESYMLQDTVDAPYQFTGNVFYDIYSADGVRMTGSSSNSLPIFSLGARTAGDNKVAISTTTNTLTLNGTITVNGDPVSVYGGKARVQLLRDDEGIETLKVFLDNDCFSIPPNSYIEAVYHTQYNSSDAVLSKQFYNEVELVPEQEFDPEMVSQGKVLYNDDLEPYAIQSGASVTMTAGYSTAARKTVTEIADTSNKGWSDLPKNSIVLPEKYSTFMYDLLIDLPTDDPTCKVVLIDALPEIGDHSPYVERDLRDSEFKVQLLNDNLDLHVYTVASIGQGATTELTTDQFVFEVNTRTVFEADDWEGDTKDWVAIDLSDGISDAESAILNTARSMRIVIDDPATITDPSHAIMPKKTQLKIHFNAKISDPNEADPGEIAWNSFGYRYTVPIGASGLTSSLNAEPLKVGVQIPSIPVLAKELRTKYGNLSVAEEDSRYEFLVYDGTGITDLDDTSEMSKAEIAEILEANSRDFTFIAINIPRGQSSGRTGFLDSLKKYEYDATSGTFVETEDRWVWRNAHKYTIFELPWEENGYVFSSMARSPINNYTFTQNEEKVLTLKAVNEYSKKGNLKLKKTVKGPNFDPNRLFTFTITMKDGNKPVYGDYNYIGTNINNGTLTFNDDGVATISLKHGQEVEIVGLGDKFTYTVEEASDEYYENTKSENASGVIVKDTTKVADFENTRISKKITVKKFVTGTMGNKNKEFRFEVYLVDRGEELNATYPLTITRNNNSVENISATFVDGSYMFNLKHGEVAEFSGLPIGCRYEVDELAASSKGYEVESTNEKGVLLEDVTSEWTNDRNLTIPTSASDFVNHYYIWVSLLGALVVLLLARKRRKD